MDFYLTGSICVITRLSRYFALKFHLTAYIMYIVAQVRDEAHGPLVFKSVPFMDAKVDVSRRCPLF